MKSTMSQDFLSPDTTTSCPHCKAMTETGTHGGCGTCGKVKFTAHGRIPPPRQPQD